MFRILFLFIMITPLFASVSYSISQERVANSQTALFEISSDQPIEKAYVAYLGTRYPFYPHPSNMQETYFALVPTSYYEKPKQKDAVIVTIQNGEKSYISVPLMIVKGKYKSEKLSVKSSKAKFSKKDSERIKRESKEAKKIYAKITPTSYITESFRVPLNSKVTSRFGNKRVFNGILKSYHSGTDFRAPTGTPITSSNAGIVVMAKNRFFAGNSVVIDHGRGIYTQYYHLSKLKVKVGERVEKAQVLGLAGSTGRSTGPHLHFGVKVQGVTVDPMQFLETVNALY